MQQDTKLYKRKIAVALFYDSEFNILVQERGTHSKAGEKYGFFGGGVEKEETIEEAIKRELKEELNYEPIDIFYRGTYSFTINLPGSKYDKETRHGELFLSPITEELLSKKPEVGTLVVKMSIDEAIKSTEKGEFGPIKSNMWEWVRDGIFELVNNENSNNKTII